MARKKNPRRLMIARKRAIRARFHNFRSRSRRISLPPAHDFLYQESDNHKKRVENPNAHGSSLIRQWITRYIRITHLDDNEGDPESDHGSFPNRQHRISRQVKHDPDAKQPDFQRKLGIPIIPQTKAHFPRVVVDREITRMRNQVENPVRQNSEAYDQSSRLSVSVAEPTAERLVTNSSDAAPKNRRDQTMRIWVEIRVKHAACGEPFDHAQLLNPKQNKRRPDVIEKLDSDEQNPQRNSVSFAPRCEGNTVMSYKHFPDKL